MNNTNQHLSFIGKQNPRWMKFKKRKTSELIIFMFPEYITIPSRNWKVGSRWYTLLVLLVHFCGLSVCLSVRNQFVITMFFCTFLAVFKYRKVKFLKHLYISETCSHFFDTVRRARDSWLLAFFVSCTETPICSHNKK